MATDTTRARNTIAKRAGSAAARRDGAGLLEKLKPGIARALPTSAAFTADRFTRLVLTEFRRNERLLDCTEGSLLAGIMLSAQLGLEIGGPLGHSYLIPFRDTKRGVTEATWILGYKGMIQLAHRSGMLQSIEARDVCEGDEFRYAYGLDEVLHHVPADGKRGPLTHVYCVARFTTGGRYWVVLSKAQVDEHRARSKASTNGPWVTDYNAMARKTAVRVAAPFLPLSPEIARGIGQDEQVLRYADDVIDVAPSDQGELDAPAPVAEPSPEPDGPPAGVDPETGEMAADGLPADPEFDVDAEPDEQAQFAAEAATVDETAS